MKEREKISNCMGHIQTGRMTCCLERKSQNLVLFKEKLNSYFYVSVDNDTVKILKEILSVNSHILEKKVK